MEVQSLTLGNVRRPISAKIPLSVPPARKVVGDETKGLLTAALTFLKALYFCPLTLPFSKMNEQ